ncbi:MAG: hypothetical protein ACK5X7_15380, partial [Pseudanabaena sp.]
GSECSFLSGASKMITFLKPTLIIEIHPTSLKAARATGDKLKQLLQELGYTSYVEMNDCDRTFALLDLNNDIKRNVVIKMAYTTKKESFIALFHVCRISSFIQQFPK